MSRFDVLSIAAPTSAAIVVNVHVTTHDDVLVALGGVAGPTPTPERLPNGSLLWIKPIPGFAARSSLRVFRP